MANFRVIIVGGGVGGLTLANCLQHAGIDFVLLEGREKIGLHIGAGIGVDPAASRILDQLGVYSDLEGKFVGTLPTRAIVLRDVHGKIKAVTSGPALLEARIGYPHAFYMRYAVLEALYKHIWDKDKVHVSKRVQHIEYGNSWPTVTCEDGSKYTGHIVVGCDGANSRVRGEMWRLSDLHEPGKITKQDKEFLTAEYRGLYALSDPVKGLDSGTFQIVTGQDQTFYWIVNKDGSVMWNLVEKLEKKYYYPNIPRYTDEDALALVEANLEKVIVSDTGDLRLKDLWEKTQIYPLFAVEEGISRVWTSGRIVCIGDSVHKVTPESGIGTLIVVESAAALANHLKRLVDNSAGKVPNSTDIEACLSRFETQRRPRASQIVQKSYEGVRFLTMATPMIRFMFKYVIPNTNDSGAGATEKYIAAERIEFLPLPERSLKGTMAFNQTQGIGKHEPLKPRALFALPLFLLTVCSWWTKQEASSLSQLFDIPVYLVWMMEGSRRANEMKAFQSTLLFGILSYVCGFTLSANLWFFLHYTFSPIELFAAFDQRLLQTNYARALLPTILLAAILPTLTFTVFPEIQLSNNIQSFWSTLPIVLALTHRLVASIVKDTTAFDRFYNVKSDLPWTRRAVFTTGFMSFALFHLVRFNNAGFFYPSIEGIISAASNPATLVHVLGGVTWLALLFKDLKNARMVERSWATLFILCSFLMLVIGPCTTLLAGWMWREEILATKRHWAAVTIAE